MPERQHATWGELLRDAVEKPRRMLEAYTAFHNYSFGNALLALEQCTRRNLQPGPLNTYRGWLEKKRQGRRGEKGNILCKPTPSLFRALIWTRRCGRSTSTAYRLTKLTETFRDLRDSGRLP